MQLQGIFHAVTEPSRPLLIRLPTGFGKSAIIRLSAAVQRSRSGVGLTYIVLEPYTALMHDQVRATEQNGLGERSQEAYFFNPPQMKQVSLCPYRLSLFVACLLLPSPHLFHTL